MLTPDAEKQLEALQNTLIESSKKLEGIVIFAPSISQIAKLMGYPGPYKLNEHKTTLTQKISAVTGGMEEIHRGVVLGDPIAVEPLKKEDLPEVSEPVDIEMLGDIIEGLSQADKQRLLGRVATN